MSAVSARTASPLRRKLAKAMSRAIADFDMIEDGDRVMVAVSGGKDSYALPELLLRLAEARADPLRAHRRATSTRATRATPAHLLTRVHRRRTATHSTSARGHLLGRHRQHPRGQDLLLALLAPAPRHPLPRSRASSAAPKIALGHHRDDALETLMLNLVFAGQLKAMPPEADLATTATTW